MLFPRFALAGGAPQLEVLAVRAPRLGLEARSAGNRHHVAVRAALRSVLWRTPPAARTELHHRGGRLRGAHRAAAVVRAGAVGARWWLRRREPERLIRIATEVGRQPTSPVRA